MTAYALALEMRDAGRRAHRPFEDDDDDDERPIGDPDEDDGDGDWEDEDDDDEEPMQLGVRCSLPARALR